MRTGGVAQVDAAIAMGALQASCSPEHLVPEPEAASQHGQDTLSPHTPPHSGLSHHPRTLTCPHLTQHQAGKEQC